MNKLFVSFFLFITLLGSCSKVVLVKDEKPKEEDQSPPEPPPDGDRPFITSVNGVWNNNATVTINGIRFGEKAIAKPVIWDNMETGAFNPDWTNTTGLSINTDNNRHPGSSYNGFHNFKSGTAGNGYFSGGTNSQTWFVQYWFKLGSNWDWGNGTDGTAGGNLANVKYFRMWSTGSTSENFVIANHGFAGGESLFANENIANGYYFWASQPEMTKDVWHLLEFEYKDSDIDQPNGEIRMWFDGVKKLELTNMVTRKASADFKRPYNVGFYDSWNGTNVSDDFYYMDDAYIDNTWSRVMLGNASTFSNCTIREIQPATSWTSTSISIKANLGMLSTGSAYLYVIDSSGKVNEKGYLISR